MRRLRTQSQTPMTLDHREVGRRLGFPECCIHQFIADIDTHTMSGQSRGAVYGFRENGTLFFYVPCQECIDDGPPENWERPKERWGSLLQRKYQSMFWENGEYIFDSIGTEFNLGGLSVHDIRHSR